MWVVRSLKSIGRLCCSVHSKRDHSIVYNGTTCDAAFCQNSSTTGYHFIAVVIINIYCLLLRSREQLQSIAMSTSVCVSVYVSACLTVSARMSPESHARSLPNFLCMLPMAVARSSSGVVAILYVLLFLWAGGIALRGRSVISTIALFYSVCA